MGQVQKTQEAEVSASSLQVRHHRYSKQRLDHVYNYAFEEFYGETRITEHLSKLVEIVPDAKTGCFFLSLIQDLLLTKIGEAEDESPLRESDELTLFSNTPLQNGCTHFHPVSIEDHVVGYVAIGLNTKSTDILLKELAEAYSVLIAHELEIIRKKREYGVKFQQLKEKERELNQHQEYSNRFLSVTSHDLSSMVSAISGYVDLIGECIHQDIHYDCERLSKYHRRLDLGLTEVSTMLKQFSDLSKIESGQVHLNMVDVNLNWPVKKVCDLFESQAIKKGIQYTVELSDEPVFVEADVFKLKRIVYNLVSNAIKYTPEGGKILVKIASLPDEARVIVKDTGIGISKRDQAKIFGPSVKLDKAKADDISSSGLGLFIASFFADLMDGAISVASKLHQGSLFTVKLPRPQGS